MKSMVLFILVFIGIAYADLSVEKISHMITKIQEKRKGISLETLENTPEPFRKIEIKKVKEIKIEVVPTVKSVEPVLLVLHAILNKKAYINDGWKNVNDIIDGFVVEDITDNSVVLSNGTQIEKLFLENKKENFIFASDKD